MSIEGKCLIHFGRFIFTLNFNNRLPPENSLFPQEIPILIWSGQKYHIDCLTRMKHFSMILGLSQYNLRQESPT